MSNPENAAKHGHTNLTAQGQLAALEAIYRILPPGLLNLPGVYFLLHRPTKRAYVGVVKSIRGHAAYLRGQFARCAKGYSPSVKLANMPPFDTRYEDWAFRAIPMGDADLLRKTLIDKGVMVVNVKSRRRGPNRVMDAEGKLAN